MFKSQNVKFSPKKWNELTPVTLKTTIQESRDEFDTILVQGLSFSVNSDDIVRESPKIYDERVKDFYSLPYEESDSAIVLRNRSYLAVGRTAEKEIIGSSYRSLLVFNPQRQISDIVGDRPYTVQNATLTLSTKDSSLASGTMYLGVALGATVDASATWDSPNPATNDEWTVGSGGGPVVQRVTIDVNTHNPPWMAPGWTYSHPNVFPDPTDFEQRDDKPCIYFQPGSYPARQPFIDLPQDIQGLPYIPVSEPPRFIKPAGSDELIPLLPRYIRPRDIGNEGFHPVIEELYFWNGQWWRRGPDGGWLVAIPIIVQGTNGPYVRTIWRVYKPCWGIRLCRQDILYTDGTVDPPIEYRWQGFGTPPWRKSPAGETPLELFDWNPYYGENGGKPPLPWISPPIDYDPNSTTVTNSNPPYSPYNPRIGEDDWKMGNPFLTPDSQHFGEEWYFDRPPCKVGDPLKPTFQGPGFENQDPFPAPPPPEIPDTLVPILEDIVPFMPWSDLFPIRSEDQSPTDPPQNSTELIERINTYLNATTTAVTLNNSAKAVFDVTTLVNEWSKNSKTPMRFIIWSPQLEFERRLVKFESSETSVGKIGDGLFLTCAFLNSENTTSIRTQGIRCIISPQNGNVLIKTVDNDADSSKNFAAFQTLVPIGATFEFRDPDINNEITLGTSICTVVDRPDDNSMVASGIPFPIALSKHETSVEFSASVPIPNGTYILDVKSPSEVSKTALMALNPNDEIAVNYSSAEENNNSKTFSVKMVSDERQFNDRIRLFLNEYVISEDRTGQPTQILRAGVVPTLKIDLLLS